MREVLSRLKATVFFAIVVSYDLILTHFAINYLGFVELNPLYYITVFTVSFLEILNILAILFLAVFEWFCREKVVEWVWIVFYCSASFRFGMVTGSFLSGIFVKWLLST